MKLKLELEEGIRKVGVCFSMRSSTESERSLSPSVTLIKAVTVMTPTRKHSLMDLSLLQRDKKLTLQPITSLKE